MLRTGLGKGWPYQTLRLTDGTARRPAKAPMERGRAAMQSAIIRLSIILGSSPLQAARCVLPISTEEAVQAKVTYRRPAPSCDCRPDRRKEYRNVSVERDRSVERPVPCSWFS